MIRHSLPEESGQEDFIHDLEALALAVGILAVVFALCLLTSVSQEAF